MSKTQSRTTRRRFLSIAASAVACLAVGSKPSSATEVTSWRGVALGAGASLRLSGSRVEIADRAIEQCLAELERLENIFSLYRSGSSLSRLNRDGVLPEPPAELLELLGICGAINAETEGVFDPTVQPLWDYHAAQIDAGNTIQMRNDNQLGEILRRTGWQSVLYNQSEVRFLQRGMAITLNGIAQGYISDRICRLLRDQGFNHALVDMGEISAIGGSDRGGPWRVGIADPVDGSISQTLAIEDRAISTSSPMGTVLQNGIGHLFNPHNGESEGRWHSVTVTAPRATLADGFSTAFCLMPRRKIECIMEHRPELSIVLKS